ncbi:hypothetical protein [Tenacibaculum xiamenense]|uniref:hypothetical protein n=1 Tax=Tenacibaculum xiamenense TaxID=1261553 RepID=UPI0038933AEE
MKTTMKIAVIAMMGISLGTNAQHNHDNQNTIYSKDGNVGIGTTTPSTKLDVNGVGTFTDGIITDVLKSKAGMEILNYSPAGRSKTLYFGDHQKKNHLYNIRMFASGEEVLNLSSYLATFEKNVAVNGNFTVSRRNNTSNYLEVNENFFKVKFGSGLGATTVIDASLSGVNLGLPVTTNDLNTNGSFKVSSLGNSTNYLEANENFFRVKFGPGLSATTVINANLSGVNFGVPLTTNKTTVQEDLLVKGKASFESELSVVSSGDPNNPLMKVSEMGTSFRHKRAPGINMFAPVLDMDTNKAKFSVPVEARSNFSVKYGHNLVDLIKIDHLSTVFKSQTGLAYQTTLELDAQKAKFSIPVEVKKNLFVKNSYGTGDLLNVGDAATTFKYLDGFVSKTTLELGGQKALFSVPVEVNGTTTIDGDLILGSLNRLSPSKSIVLRNAYGTLLNINSGEAVFKFQSGRALINALEMNLNRAKFNIPMEALSANFNGKVGIGTETTGNHKLAVEGSIGAREIKVEATGWSDFVFYDDYQLPTLKEVEAHIQEKGHLKDIPSAKEVEKEGFFLGEMDAKLLQKIEELTLYTIQQEKKIESLQKQNEEIQSQQKQIDAQKKEIEELKKMVKSLVKD